MKKTAQHKPDSLVERFQHLRRVAFVLDTETTGSNRQNDEVIELGVVRASNGEILINSRFRPSKKSEVWAYKVHKISDRELLGKPRFADLWGGYFRVLDGAVIAGWNVAFDKQMLEATCAKYDLPVPSAEWVDLMPLYRDFKRLPKNCKLSEACEQMRVKPGDHNAVNDALAAARVVYAVANTEAEKEPEQQAPLFEPEVNHSWDIAEIESWYAESDDAEDEFPAPVVFTESDATIAYTEPILDGQSVRFPFSVHSRFRYWAGGQPLWQTLAELNAPAATVRRYCARVEQLHGGLQRCAGRVVELPEVNYCVLCGWYEEAETRNEMAEFLGF